MSVNDWGARHRSDMWTWPPGFAAMADSGDEGSVCGRSVRHLRLAGLDACEFVSLQPRRMEIWHVRAESPSPQHTHRFTHGRFHCLQRMMRVAGWMRQESVDDRLEQLVDLFNADTLRGSMQLKYKRTRMRVTGATLCNSVHAESSTERSAVYELLAPRVRWADGTQVEQGDAIVFVYFLKGTFVRSRVQYVVWVDVAVPDSLHLADADRIPAPRAVGAWRCAVAVKSVLLHSHPLSSRSTTTHVLIWIPNRTQLVQVRWHCPRCGVHRL